MQDNLFTINKDQIIMKLQVNITPAVRVQRTADMFEVLGEIFEFVGCSFFLVQGGEDWLSGRHQ